ncbi:hypothetical protein PHMEG_00027091 [Phytophthora megakarya]|uniref:Uncharacterized protein n=1 Tax=Phytophthora megakarya TaxID=4795 RepID=A0A225V955_9STRA|nr:hypothetical protein PHMEG_00027091 [Phytophthora megakarya]
MKLRVQMETPGIFLLTPPRGTRPFTIRHFRQLRRWCASIFACVPLKVWTTELAPIQPRNFPPMIHKYLWHTTSGGDVIATDADQLQLPVFKLVQDGSGWAWTLEEWNHDKIYEPDMKSLRFEQKLAGLAFHPTPYLHPTPWRVSIATKAVNICKSIRKQRSTRLRRCKNFDSAGTR